MRADFAAGSLALLQSLYSPAPAMVLGNQKHKSDDYTHLLSDLFGVYSILVWGEVIQLLGNLTFNPTNFKLKVLYSTLHQFTSNRLCSITPM